MRLSGLQVITQDDGGTNLVDQLFVLARLTTQAGINHGLMGQHRREALVVVLDRNLRLGLAPSPDKLLHPPHVFTGLPVGLLGFANDDAFYGFATDVCQQEVV